MSFTVVTEYFILKASVMNWTVVGPALADAVDAVTAGGGLYRRVTMGPLARRRSARYIVSVVRDLSLF
jgi:hypothetical protein